MRRADPSLGTTKVAFAVRTRSAGRRPSLGTIMAMGGGPGYGSTASPYGRFRALGLGRVFLYGDSYGTLLGQAYAARNEADFRA